MAKGKDPAVSKAKKTEPKDLMFGVKNRKGAQNRKHEEKLKKSAISGNSEAIKAAQAAEARKLKKSDEEAARRELDMLLNKPAQIQRVPFGVDPKTVVCIFYRNRNCEKGNKCKFSHDLGVERKTDKKDVYQDTRETEEERKRQETNDDWDEEKLRSVVLSKKGNQQTTTDKVCKYFITAIEDGKYGWFWVCPNGGDKCKYKHALPPGFVLKTKEQRAAEKAILDKSPLKTLTLEEFLESERHKLSGTLTPVTPESFAKWKKDRMDKKAAEEELRKAKEATGRALFESGNWRTIDAEADADDDDDGDDGDDDGVWNLEKMRKETELLRAKKEEERLAAQFGGPVDASVYDGLDSMQIKDDDGDYDKNDGDGNNGNNNNNFSEGPLDGKATDAQEKESDRVSQDEPPADSAPSAA